MDPKQDNPPSYDVAASKAQPAENQKPTLDAPITARDTTHSANLPLPIVIPRESTVK